MDLEKRGVGLNPNTYIHLTDHLAPLCQIMGIPLLLTDEKHAQETEQLYPGLEILLVNWLDVTPEYLMGNFDVFFQSEPWHRHKFYAKVDQWEKLYNKTIRNVHCPHGFSDKVSWFEQSVWEDILLVYGDKMLSLFEESGISEHLNATVRVGNYRYSYYKENQTFYDRMIQEKIWSQLDSSKPTILYAPTLNNLEYPTSFFDADHLMDQLPDAYNLIVKIHPALEVTDGPRIYSMIGKYDQRDNITFVRDFSPVYPILAHSDIYIGDVSAIGYDFLAFNRPMFFLNHLNRNAKQDRNLFLYRCGFEIQPEQYKDFYKILEAQLPLDKERYSGIRHEVYRSAFGEEMSFKNIKEAVTKAYLSSKS